MSIEGDESDREESNAPEVVSPSPGPAPRLSTTSAWLLAVGATLTMSVSYFDRHTLAVIAPRVTESLAIDEQHYGYIVSAFSFAYLVGAPLAGRVVDRYGARRVLPLAVLAWTAVAWTQSLAGSFTALLLLRVALGLCEAPSFPGAAQTVTRALPLVDRPRGFGLLFTGSSIGALVASIVATRLTAYYGWRYAFGVTAFAGLVWIPMWLVLTRGRAARSALDARAPSTDIPRAPALRPSLWATITNQGVLRSVVLVLVSAPLANFILNWSAKYLKAVERVDELHMGTYAWLPPVLFDLGSLGFGYLASRFVRARRGSHLLFVAAGLCASVLPLCLVVPGPWPAAILCGLALGGIGGLFAMLTADMLTRVPAGAVSTAGGITAAAQSLAYIVSGLLIGRSLEKSGSYAGSIMVLSALIVPGVAVWLVWRPAPEAEHRAARF